MKVLKALSKEQASDQTKEIFDGIQQKVGRVPNLYAAIGNSPNLLSGFLQFGETLSNGVFSKKEQEAIALAVSQSNGCTYCISAHTALGKMAGFSEEETLELREGTSRNNKLNALTNLALEITENKGKASTETKERFFEVGYSEAAFAELIGFVSLRTLTNYIFTNGDFEIDFPKAQFIEGLAKA
ncbi:MAG: putative peroxidase-related enzyme [Polaribacter sp.]|jgi:uncharacterized peroxidase-related enzyme